MKSIQTKDIRFRNRLEILRIIAQKQPISRVEIGEITKLNKATISAIVKEMLKEGFVAETSVGDSNGGRRPIMLCQKENLGYCISIDLNVSTVQMILTDLSNTILQKRYISLCGINYIVNFHRLCEAIKELMAEIPASRYGLVGIGVSVRGVIDLDGKIRFIPSLKWRDINLKVMLEDVFQIPVYIDNDGNLAALAELKAAPNSKEMIVLTVDDVITAGLVSGGKLLRGYLGFANAVGHHIVNCLETTACSCGKFGCWEQYCSHPALLSDLSHRLGKHVSSVDQFINLLQQNDAHALAALDQFLHYLAIGIGNLIFILNSETIILHSQILAAYPKALEMLRQKIVLPITKDQDIVLSQLGKDAALLGASSMAVEQFYHRLFNEIYSSEKNGDKPEKT